MKHEHEKILWEAFRQMPEYKEIQEQIALAVKAEADLVMHGKSAVEMDGNRIVRVIDHESEEFPKCP